MAVDHTGIGERHARGKGVGRVEPAEAKRARPTRIAWLALTAAMLGASTALVFTLRPSPHGDVAPCANRVVIVALSSSERSPRMAQNALEVVAQVGVSSAVCGRSGQAFAVAGGGEVFSLLSGDDVARFAPAGPNRAVRLSRLGTDTEAKVHDLVSGRLRAAYTAGAPLASSIAALYQVAAEHADPDTDIILITDGVNSDSQVNLNRPLQSGDGSRLANKISIPAIGNRLTTVIGIAQVDSATPPPGPSWPTEVRAFNERLCERSGAHACRLFSVASTVDALTV